MESQMEKFLINARSLTITALIGALTVAVVKGIFEKPAAKEEKKEEPAATKGKGRAKAA